MNFGDFDGETTNPNICPQEFMFLLLSSWNTKIDWYIYHKKYLIVKYSEKSKQISLKKTQYIEESTLIWVFSIKHHNDEDHFSSLEPS